MENTNNNSDDYKQSYPIMMLAYDAQGENIIGKGTFGEQQYNFFGPNAFSNMYLSTKHVIRNTDGSIGVSALSYQEKKAKFGKIYFK